MSADRRRPAEDKTDYAKARIGKWEVTKADEGTVPAGTIVEFTKDGKINLTIKAGDKDMTVPGTYTVEKNTFTMTFKMGDQEHKETITITKASETEMSTSDKDKKVVEAEEEEVTKMARLPGLLDYPQRCWGSIENAFMKARTG